MGHDYCSPEKHLYVRSRIIVVLSESPCAVSAKTICKKVVEESHPKFTVGPQTVRHEISSMIEDGKLRVVFQSKNALDVVLVV